MADTGNSRARLQFRFSRASDDRPAVPVSVLIQTLESAQRAIWLIALASEQKDVRLRARIPAEIEQRYQLKCETPEPGSYILPAFVESTQPRLATMDQVEAVLTRMEDVARALQSHDRELVATYLPDSSIRKRVVDAFQKLAPKAGSGWRLDFSRNGTTVRMDDGWQRSVRRMYAPAETEPERETVNGELIQVHFADRQITIQPIGSTLQLKVTYPEAMEDFLLENRREVIQVTGRVSRNEDGELKSIFDPESIAPLDLSPLEIDEVESDGLRLRFQQTARFEPHLDEENSQFLRIEDARLGVDIFAGTVSDLIEELASDLIALWREYAKAPDAELAPKALDLKFRLLEALEEVPVGE